MAVWLVFLLLAADVLIVAALSRSRDGALVGAGVALLFLPIPALVAAPPFARALIGVAFFLVVVRALDMVRDGPLANVARRALHLVAVVDTRTPARTRAASSLDLVVGIAWLSVTGASVYVIQAASTLGIPRPGVWLAAAAGLVGAVEGLHGLTGWLGGIFRASIPPISLQPYRSVTLAEFWGKRWNPVVSDILRTHCFNPLARHPRAALVAAFIGSAVLHWYLTLVSLDATMALMAGAFFVAQTPLMFVERRLAVRRWPRAAGMAWTIGVLLVTWPLLAEPVVRLFER